ncbi:hypothetical protein BKA70DRAFT_1097614 [Coprinopsis sp. MPI-PUGE-AT-0042]|nr:hypothetical protein BKA70DRAFT_1097614 [Coprinopsis sp. MPI-PUGE-AT-0042]
MYGRVGSISSEGISSNGHGLNNRKNRGSLLGAATGAFGNLRFGRKRPAARPQPPLPRILPDVIEICAPLPDHEMEERNRLREEAAQAIGIHPYPSHTLDRADSTEDDEDDEEALRTPADSSDLRRFKNTRSSGSSPEFASKSFSGDNDIIPVIASPAYTNEPRSGSIAHMRNNSTAFSAVPLYPTDVLSLNAFLVWDGHLPKYSQPSTMRIFALTTKGWKNRYIIFSTPQMVMSKMRIPASSFLHVFKSAEPDEKELERLEINEDSVIFVSEDEVGGRRSVIKVGGLDIGTGKQQSGKVAQTIWHLQITDSRESQKWISTIKNAILGQRTVRAGLGHATPSSGFEPRGDLDVMLSIRAQGLSTTLRSPTVTSPAREGTLSPTSDAHYASSISSQSVRSQATVPKNPVATLKGFFSSRPRSSSLATSVYSEQILGEEAAKPGKLKVRTANLNCNSSNPPSAATTPVPHRQGRLSSPWDSASIRHPLPDRQTVQWGSTTIDGQGAYPRPVEGRSSRAMSLGSTSLRPPPRAPNRWGTTRPTSPHSPVDEHGFTYVNRDPRMTTVFGARPSMDSPNAGQSESPQALSAPVFDQRSRVSSLKSVSTHTSDNSAIADKSTVSTKRSSRRWSKPLPQRLTPPAGPPPAIPPLSSPKLDDRQFSTSSVRSSTRSTSSSKRDSVSSTLSADSSMNSGSVAASTQARSRLSIPPPARPAPTIALPTPPEQQDTSRLSEPPTPPPTKSSFRNSVSQRAMRLSMIAAPKPPPSGTLPPRPDEPEPSTARGHRKSTSSGKIPLNTIPEPTQQHNYPNHNRHSMMTAPLPPPAGPLPPPPNGALTPTATPPSSRRSSLKQRFKELSGYPNRLSSSSIEANGSATPTGMPQYHSYSAPTSPLERVTFEDPSTPSFLNMSTPTMHSSAGVRMYEEDLHVPQDTLDHVVSLSPPPRRHSVHKALVERNVAKRKDSASPSSVAASVSAVGPSTDNTSISPPNTPSLLTTSLNGADAAKPARSPAELTDGSSVSIITNFTDDKDTDQDTQDTDADDMASPTDSVDNEGYEVTRPHHDDRQRLFSLSPPPPSVLSFVASSPTNP